MVVQLMELDEKILGFVERFIDEHGYSPCYKEIYLALGRAKTTVVTRVKALVLAEYLEQGPAQHRSIRPGPRLRR